MSLSPENNFPWIVFFYFTAKETQAQLLKWEVGNLGLEYKQLNFKALSL